MRPIGVKSEDKEGDKIDDGDEGKGEESGDTGGRDDIAEAGAGIS